MTKDYDMNKRLKDKWGIPLFTPNEFDFLLESNEIESEEGVDTDHLQAFIQVKQAIGNGQLLLNHQFILDIHNLLMMNKLRKYRGEYRTTNVCLMKGPQLIKQFPNAAGIAFMMDGWIEDFNKSKKTPWELHKEFENIHPFIDGNGRTGRLLWAFDLLRRGKSVYPILNDFENRASVHSSQLEDIEDEEVNLFDNKRQRYYDLLG